MPSEHYFGIDSTEDIFKVPGYTRTMTHIIRGLREHADGTYTGWIRSFGRIYNVILDNDEQHFRVISERGYDEQHNQD